jgi:hypothetical protein
MLSLFQPFPVPVIQKLTPINLSQYRGSLQNCPGITRKCCPRFSGIRFFRIFGAGDDAMAYYSAIAGFSCSIS